MSAEYSKRQPGALPFGEDWARFARRQSDARRLAFFDTFLKMAGGWIPGDDATADELDDYDRMERLLSAYLNGKSGGRPSKAAKTPSKTPTETPSKTPSQNPIEGRKEGRKGSKEGTTTALTREKSPPLTEKQFVDIGLTAGIPADFARQLYATLASVGWTDGKGCTVRANARYLKSAWLAEQKKISGARVEPLGGISLDDIQDVR